LPHVGQRSGLTGPPLLGVAAHEKLFVSLLEPQGGPTAGGTEVHSASTNGSRSSSANSPQPPSDTPCLSGAQITVHGSMFQQSDDLKCKFRRVPHVNCGTGYHVHNATCDMAPETVVDATFLSYWSLKCLSPTGFPESIGGTAHAPADGLPALPVDALNDIKTAPSVTFVEVALDAYHYTDHQREYHYYGEGLRLAHTHPPASTREWRSHSPGALAQMTPSSRSLRLTPLVVQQQAALSSRSSVLALRSSAVLSCTARPYSEREQEAGTPFLKN